MLSDGTFSERVDLLHWTPYTSEINGNLVNICMPPYFHSAPIQLKHSIPTLTTGASGAIITATTVSFKFPLLLPQERSYLELVT